MKSVPGTTGSDKDVIAVPGKAGRVISVTKGRMTTDVLFKAVNSKS